jgi:hypothetical protein
MCSYIVINAALPDSYAKGAGTWTKVDAASVYYDHPYHSPLDHALGVDITNTDGQRIALELSPEAARALVAAIEAALANGEREHGELPGRVPMHDHAHHHPHPHDHGRAA